MKLKISFFRALTLLCLGFFVLIPKVFAMTPGTLVYRTSSDGKMYGYSSDSLISADKNKILKHIYPGHVGIYIGQENGEDYIVEALAGGIVKTPAKNFVNESQGEKLLGAKLPIQATPSEIAKAVIIAKNLVGHKLGYDFDFKKQKGPGNGEWTCVGLTEKIYESSGISNPNNLGSLEYNQNYYAVNITPDGFDNYSLANKDGDCFSKNLEFSKIERKTDLYLPLPEIVGFNVGVEYNGERYIFLPYTQFLQSSLRNEAVDIQLSDAFNDDDVRGKTPAALLLLRWSLINNPLSSLKIIANKTGNFLSDLKTKIFGSDNQAEIVWENNQEVKQPTLNKEELAKDNIITEKININQASSDDYQEAIGASPGGIIESGDVMIVEDIQDDSQIKIADNKTVVPLVSKQNIPEQTSKINTQVIPSQTLKESVQKLISAVSITNSSSTISTSNNTQSSASVSKIVAGVRMATNNSTGLPGAVVQSSFNEPKAVINKIYSTENNDFIELYNPTDYDFDLAEANFRLEKAKTAVDPSLMMRIGNPSDGLYPGGTMIKAKGYYLIVRDDANTYYKNKADAIAIRNEFSWTGSGYIIYLGKDALSSTADEDIIDAVGYGEATYFQGSGPALKIEDNYVLNRIKSSGNNNEDFNLIVSDDPNIVWDETNQDNQTDNNQGVTETPNNEQTNNQNNFQSFIFPEPIASEGIIDLWHFSECYGENNYSVGRFDCSIEIKDNYPIFSKTLSANVDLNKTALSFYYRNSKHSTASPRLNLKLKSDGGQEMNILLEPGLFQLEGLPNSNWRYWGAPVFSDDNWHQFTLVVNKDEGYWAAYFDNQEKYKQAFVQTLATNFSSIELSGDMGSVSVDEFAIWNRPLTFSEIKANLELAAPFSPLTDRVAQIAPELKYFWNFDEGSELVNDSGGMQAVDEIKNLKIDLPENSWVWRGTNNTGIINKWGNNLGVDLPAALKTKDMSLAFWWRSNFYPNEGRSLVSLKKGTSNQLGLSPDQVRRSFYFNGQDGIFSEGGGIDLPYDELWHHFAVTYDSYRYSLDFYIDGQKKTSRPFVWVKDGQNPNRLEINSELNSVEMDDLGIWEGALSTSSVLKIYEDSKIAN